MQWIKVFASEAEALKIFESQKIYTIGVNEQRVCVVHRGNAFYAFSARCPHAGASLSDGYLNQNLEIVCPLHGYRFSLLDGRQASRTDCTLPLFPLEIRQEGVFLGWR
jgi:nitrite reductase/ring-hydroxylating ferredoxin subunit